ncbi:MAG: hypothetical protein JWO30_1600 [Fibrobacteres bacterium]|nr:hypothetical protein [Fibrobacterota bacterium]
MRNLLSAAVLAVFPFAAWGLPAGFTSATVATGLDVSFLCALGDGRILVNEKHGVVRVIKDDKLLAAPLLDISASVQSAVERGLLGIAADPDFAANGYVYLFHNDKDDHAYISRYTVQGDVADPASAKTLFDLGVHGAPYHHGGDVTFGPDGKVYFTQGNAAGYLGDAKTVSQNKNDLLGSIFRINPDGSIPNDNPFYATNTGNARAVWTYGNRNPFNLRFQPGTGLGYFSDVQDDNFDDEINEAKTGANYGYGGGSAPVAPLLAYGANGTAQIGGAFYAADQFPAEYRGLFFFGNNGNGFIKTLDPKTKKVATFESLAGDCVISMDVGAKGSLYASARCGDAASTAAGKVFKFTYPGGAAANRSEVRPLKASEVMQWSVSARGGLRINLLQAGPQSLEVRRADGTLEARAPAAQKGWMEIRAELAPGVHLLVWRAGSRKVIAKILSE